MCGLTILYSHKTVDNHCHNTGRYTVTPIRLLIIRQSHTTGRQTVSSQQLSGLAQLGTTHTLPSQSLKQVVDFEERGGVDISYITSSPHQPHSLSPTIYTSSQTLASTQVMPTQVCDVMSRCSRTNQHCTIVTNVNSSCRKKYAEY